MVFTESCSSISTFPANKNENQFSLLNLGDSESDVEKAAGKPSELRNSDDEKLWIYNNTDAYSTQRAAITFDSKTGLVNGVTIIPLVNDIDSKLNYLQSKKFPASDYVEAPLGRCHRDYFPKEVFYISPSKGFIIVLDSVSNSVESYSWTTTQYATDLIKKIKNCER